MYGKPTVNFFASKALQACEAWVTISMNQYCNCVQMVRMEKNELRISGILR